MNTPEVIPVDQDTQRSIIEIQDELIDCQFDTLLPIKGILSLLKGYFEDKTHILDTIIQQPNPNHYLALKKLCSKAEAIIDSACARINSQRQT